MSFYKYAAVLIAGLSISSCVKDEIVFQDKSDQIRFSRSLASVAVDENPVIEVDITDRFTGEDKSASYSLSFTSSNPEVISVNNQGVLSPVASAISQSAIITVSATLITSEASPNATPVQISVVEGDEIIVGAITLSENEALGFPAQDVDNLIANGFEPRGVINNRLSQIDIESRDQALNATFFNLKNEDLDNPVLTWSSDKPEIITIDENGLLTPVSMGTATINVSTIINQEEVFAEPLTITVSGETVVEEEEMEEEMPTVVGFGTIQSNSSYDAGGDFQIIEFNGQTTIVLADNFTSGGRVPDLVIYLSNQTNTNTGAQFISEDIEAEGKQTFIVPEGVNVDNYANVLIYCRQFSARVGFGVINR